MWYLLNISPDYLPHIHIYAYVKYMCMHGDVKLIITSKSVLLKNYYICINYRDIFLCISGLCQVSSPSELALKEAFTHAMADIFSISHQRWIIANIRICRSWQKQAMPNNIISANIIGILEKSKRKVSVQQQGNFQFHFSFLSRKENTHNIP